jgi:inner membrane protein
VYRSGHYGVALLAYAPALYVLAAEGRLPVAVAGGALVLALATLPDVDHAIPLVDHRGVTHTLAFAALVGGAVWAGVMAAPVEVASRELVAYAAAGLAAFSVLTHLLADALTPVGVPLFWPLTTRRYSLGVTPAGHPFWNVGLLVLGVVAVVAAVALTTPVY